MTPRELSEGLKSRAGASGFDAVRIAAAVRLDRDAARLSEWLASGRHAEMKWMARSPEMRADPRQLLPECRSVVVVAANYWPGAGQAATPAGRARVALYARGRDYHKILGRRLKGLSAWLESVTGSATRSFVDTGPVLERAWAEQAGLGWIGKNSLLLTREQGSWILLGEILTAAELAPDEGPHQDHCGSCTACIEVCPTDAIVADGEVDSNRCISYWTIEHRGPIPRERRDGVDDWIFGCDLCQDVCPWNRRFAQTVRGDPFETREDLRGLDASEILGMDEAEFRARYSGTSLMRAKWEGMRRNACVVLGNSGSREATPALTRALDDSDPVVRGHAAWALGRIEGRRVRPLLEQAARRESVPEVLEEIHHVLRQVPE